MHPLLFVLNFLLLAISVVECENNHPPVVTQPESLNELVDAPRIRSLYNRLGAAVSRLYGSPSALPVGATPADNRMSFRDVKVGPIEQANKNVKDILFQMDEVLTEKQINRLIGDTEEQSKKRGTRQALKISYAPDARWPNGIMYYAFVGASGTIRNYVRQAMDFYTEHTCIRFEETTTVIPRVRITDSDLSGGCWSYVGRQTDLPFPQQVLNLGPGCESMGIAAHELAHALGIHHEHSRYDRDNHVIVDLSNVQEPDRHNFAMGTTDDMALYNLPYDTGSIMQYGPYMFAIDVDRPVVDTKIPNLFYDLGQDDAPTFRDVYTLNIHYNCLAKCPTGGIVCLHGGYKDPNHCTSCKCPRGWGSPNCGNREASTFLGCGGNLVAATTDKTFSITIAADNNANKQRRCIYHVKTSKPGNQLIINVTRVVGFCENGCYTTAAEVKWSTNQQITGARYCCNNAPRTVIISNAPSVPIIMFTKKSSGGVTFTYRERAAPSG